MDIKQALKWALEYIGDGYLPDEGTPDHDCGYKEAPDKGYCGFCEKYWEAREALKEAEIEKPIDKINTVIDQLYEMFSCSGSEYYPETTARAEMTQLILKYAETKQVKKCDECKKEKACKNCRNYNLGKGVSDCLKCNEWLSGFIPIETETKLDKQTTKV